MSIRMLVYTLSWVFILAALLFLIAWPVCSQVFAARLEYLATDEGHAEIERKIAHKVLERYSEEALSAYEEGRASYHVTAQDVVFTELYGPPLLLLAGILIGSVAVIAVGFSVVKRIEGKKRRPK